MVNTVFDSVQAATICICSLMSQIEIKETWADCPLRSTDRVSYDLTHSVNQSKFGLISFVFHYLALFLAVERVINFDQSL